MKKEFITASDTVDGSDAYFQAILEGLIASKISCSQFMAMSEHTCISDGGDSAFDDMGFGNLHVYDVLKRTPIGMYIIAHWFGFEEILP